MHVIKAVGAIVSVLLLTMLILVLLGVLGRSLIGLVILFAILFVIAALAWGRRMDVTASKSWFLRQFDRGATRAHDRLLQDDDALRERTAAQQQWHNHDLD